MNWLPNLPTVGFIGDTPEVKFCRASQRTAGIQVFTALILLLVCALPSPAAEQNPFESAARQSYTGRFHGQGLELRLFPQAGKWNGSLLFQGNTYTVTAELKPTGLEGTFARDNQSWPFTALANGNSINFVAGSFSALLQRQSLPRLEGRWHSPRVLLLFDPPANAVRTGHIQFDGRDFTFRAQEKAGDLEGTFQDNGTAFDFRIANETRGLVFHTSTFSEIITPVPTAAVLRIQTTPSAAFTLLNDGTPMAEHDGKFELPAEREARLELRAEDYQPARTNLVPAAYSDQTWNVVLRPILYPRAGLNRWTNSLGMIFVPVPRTRVLFCIWDTRVRDWAAYAESIPGADEAWRHSSYEGARASQGPDHPATMVSWSSARDFCRWLTQKELEGEWLVPGQQYRLPTDAEWSLAVGLDKESQGLPARKNDRIKDVYPWGTQWPPPPDAGNFADTAAGARFKDMRVIIGYADGFATTSPVGFFKPNGFGLFDMSGNVWQWCEDWFDRDHKRHVVRGGSWRSAEPELLVSSARLGTPDGRDSNLGFRCVLTMVPP